MSGIPAELDAAYARQCGITYDGTRCTRDYDGLATTVKAFALFFGAESVVTVDVGQTNVRLDLTPAAARDLAALLVEAAESAEAGHDCADHPDECCGQPIPITGTPGGAA